MTPKGRPKPKASGRKKGVQNKATKDIKEAYKMLIEDNLDNLSDWLDKIGKQDPFKAVNILIGLSEFVVPKLARTENKNENTNNNFTFNETKTYDTKPKTD